MAWRFRLVGLVMACLGVIVCSSTPQSVHGWIANRQVLVIELSEFEFKPNAVQIKSGPMTFRVVNRGKVPHTFTSLALGFDTGIIEPGRSKTITVTLRPGKEHFVCLLAGHQEAGMVGTLTATARPTR